MHDKDKLFKRLPQAQLQNGTTQNWSSCPASLRELFDARSSHDVEYFIQDVKLILKATNKETVPLNTRRRLFVRLDNIRSILGGFARYKGIAKPWGISRPQDICLFHKQD